MCVHLVFWGGGFLGGENGGWRMVVGGRSGVGVFLCGSKGVSGGSSVRVRRCGLSLIDDFVCSPCV